MRSKLLILAILFLLTAKIASAATIKINEFSAAGSTTSNPDWVEIYNDGADISLYQLMDAANNKKDLAGTTCNSNFCTIDWYNYLNNSGDTIKLVLKTTIGAPVDQVIYGNTGDVSVPAAGQSAGRNPDIIGNWIISSLPTKGGPNNSSTPVPTQTPTPPTTPISTSTPQSSLFSITNIPSQINSDQSFNAKINLSSPNNPNTNFYLKGAFKKADSSNYFGLTKVNGDWIKNGNSYSDQYSITTDSSGNWSGNLEVKPDGSDSGFTGSGDYIFKVGKYNSTDSSPSVSWSNETTIQITGDPATPSPTSKVSPSNSPSLTLSKPPTPKPSQQLKSYRIASIAAATISAITSATPEAAITVKNQKQTNPMLWVGIIFIFAGISLIGYIYFRKNAKTHL